MMRARLLVAFLLVAFTGAASAQLYRWTDEKGRVHITDTPPPPNARAVEERKPRAGAVESGQPPYELTLAMKDFPVVLYTSPSCKEGCAQARDALNKRGVPFKEVQVWDDQSNEELKKVSGSNQVPTLVVGRSVHKGFEQGAYDALLDSARYPKAGSLRARAQAAPQLPEGYATPEEPPKAEPGKLETEEPKPTGPYSPGSRPPPRPQKK
jgi:glutaredoxin